MIALSRAVWPSVRAPVFEYSYSVPPPAGCLDDDLVDCEENPCVTATCGVEGAQCVQDNCLECHARWFKDLEEVTDLCTTGLPPNALLFSGFSFLYLTRNTNSFALMTLQQYGIHAL